MLSSEAARPAPVRLSKRRRVLTDLARIFSTVCNPFLTALALFVILAHANAPDPTAFWRLAFTSIFFSSIGPMLYVLWLYSTDRIADLDMSVRSEREAVFTAFVAFYVAGTIVLWLMHAPRVLTASMGGYAVATAIIQYITRYWKISTHASAITASLTALVYLYKWQPLPFVYLKAHTVGQVLAGIALGLTSVLLAFHVFKLI
jgi:hypothetical protein